MNSQRRTIVLIHGLYLNWESWGNWVERYTARGFDVVAAPWPGLEGTVAELRTDPTPMKGLTMKAVADHFDAYLRTFPTPPIVMGHSFGGFFAELMAHRELCDVAVAIDPTAPAGIFKLPLESLKAALPVLGNPFGANDATMPTPEQFHYGFTNTEPPEIAQPLYDRFTIPCVNRVFFDGTLENFNPESVGRVDVTAKRSPVLLIAGGADHIVTPEFTRAHFALIAQSPSLTAFKEFPGRPHFTGAVPGWEAVADYALEWALYPVATAPETVAR